MNRFGLLVQVSILASALTHSIIASAETGFEKMVRENGGQIPFPLEELRKKLPGGAAFVPHGRSLQKDLTNFEKPRIVGEHRGRTFFGYSEAGDQVEVISWDPEARDFKFFLVHDYVPGKKPHLKPVTDGTCFVCHQNKGPIFPNGPWREMSAPRDNPSSGELYNRLKKAHPNGYQGVSLENTGSGHVASFDATVRGASQRLRRARMFKEACGKDLKCRSFLLSQSLRGALLGENYQYKPWGDDSSQYKLLIAGRSGFELGPHSPDFDHFKKTIQEHFPKDSFSYASSAFPDRDPLSKPGDPPGFRVIASSDPRFKSDPNFTYMEEVGGNLDHDTTKKGSFVYQRPGQDREFIDTMQIPLTAKEAKMIDPTTPRPRVGGLTLDEVIHELLGDDLMNLPQEDVKKYLGDKIKTHEDLQKLIANPQVQKALQKWPPSSDALMAALLKAAGASEKDLPECYQGQDEAVVAVETHAHDAMAVVKSIDHASPAVQKLNKYCGECHKPGSAIPVPVDDLAKAQAFRGKKGRTVLSTIENGQMPPKMFFKSHPELKDAWEKDKTELVEALK